MGFGGAIAPQSFGSISIPAPPGHARPGKGSGNKKYLDDNRRHTCERGADHPF